MKTSGKIGRCEHCEKEIKKNPNECNDCKMIFCEKCSETCYINGCVCAFRQSEINSNDYANYFYHRRLGRIDKLW